MTHGKALGAGAGREMGVVLRTRPRPILVKLAISLGLGLAYLGFIRLFHWDDKSELLPFLALYALSGVIGGVVCTNALSWDAVRVRDALTGGRRLWHILLSKNLPARDEEVAGTGLDETERRADVLHLAGVAGKRDKGRRRDDASNDRYRAVRALPGGGRSGGGPVHVRAQLRAVAHRNEHPVGPVQVELGVAEVAIAPARGLDPVQAP